MKYISFAIVLSLFLYVEVFVQFPLFILAACCALFFIRTWFMASVVLVLSLLLDSLMVNAFGVTAIFVFGYVLVAHSFLKIEGVRGRLVLFVTLLLTSVFYSMVVEYSAHVGSYVVLCIGYGIFELVVRRRISSKTLQWV